MKSKIFMAIVFPAEREKQDLTLLATRFLKNLFEICENPKPITLKSEAAAFTIAMKGEYLEISKSLELSASIDTSYVLFELGEKYESRGLAKLDQWLLKAR